MYICSVWAAIWKIGRNGWPWDGRLNIGLDTKESFVTTRLAINCNCSHCKIIIGIKIQICTQKIDLNIMIDFIEFCYFIAKRVTQPIAIHDDDDDDDDFKTSVTCVSASFCSRCFIICAACVDCSVMILFSKSGSPVIRFTAGRKKRYWLLCM